MLAANRVFNQLDPWRMFDQLMDSGDQMRDLIAHPGRWSAAPVNVWTADEQAVVAMELPGFEPADIDVSVHRNTVKITATAKAEELPEGAKFLRRERPEADIARSVNLPFELDPERVDAVYEKGILKLTLHRHPSSLPAKIQVKAG